MKEIKPGFKTSELYLTIANAILMILVAFGIINQEQSDIMSLAWVQFATAGIALIAAIMPIVTYIRSRTEIKSKK